MPQLNLAVIVLGLIVALDGFGNIAWFHLGWKNHHRTFQAGRFARGIIGLLVIVLGGIL